MANSKCPICGDELEETFSLGNLYLSNFIKSSEKSEDYPKSNLTMMACEFCGAGVLKDIVNPDILYTKYWYYSGINQTMRDCLLDVVQSCLSSIRYNTEDIWLDIASNDGTLLSKVPSSFTKIGIDPADNTIQDLARKHATIVNDFFSAKAYSTATNKKAKIITCIAMFYDLINPHPFLEDIYDILDDGGLFVIQMSYTPLMFIQKELGNVCAEHVIYYSLKNLKHLLDTHGLKIVDCELNDVNGGSFRVYCTKESCEHFRNPQQRDVATIRIESLLEYEKSKVNIEEFKRFGNEINQLKQQTNDFITSEISKGKTIYCYGSSTKGNTLLQYFNLSNQMIPKIAERNPAKHGLKTIGTEIPICSEEEMRRDNPDYLLVLPWHFEKEFIEREKKFLSNGGKMIFLSPKFRIV